MARERRAAVASAESGADDSYRGAVKGLTTVRDFVSPYLIQDVPGFTPQIGRLVVMMNYARKTTLEAVEGLTVSQLDHLQDPESNTIGALLAHIAAINAAYQVHTFEGRSFTEEEEQQWGAAAELGERARRDIRGHPLEYYLTLLQTVRARTLEELSRRSDDWLYEQSTADLHAVDHAYREMSDILRTDQPVAFLFLDSVTRIVHRRVKGLSALRPNPLRFTEDLWLEDGSQQ